MGEKKPRTLLFLFVHEMDGVLDRRPSSIHFNEHNSRLVDFLYPQQRKEFWGGFWNSLLLATMNVLTVRSLFAPFFFQLFTIYLAMYSK